MDTDRDLAARLATDLAGAFPDLVRAHQDRLYTIALRLLGDPRDAEEVAQDAFLRAHRAVAGWPVERIRELRIRPWLATIVVNAARTRGRRRAAQPTELDLADLEPVLGGDGPVLNNGHAPLPGPEATAVRRDTTRALAAEVAALPALYRAPVVLRHVDGLSYAEMAEALDRPEPTLRAQVHRGLALLRASLEAREREQAIEPVNPPHASRATGASLTTAVETQR